MIGNIAQALELYKQAHEISYEIGKKEQESQAVINFADIYNPHPRPNPPKWYFV